MVGLTSSVNVILADLLTPILLKIGVEPTREGVIKLHQLVSGNAESVLSRPSRTYHTDNDEGGIHSRDEFSIWAAAQPWQLPANHRKLPRASA